METQTKICPWGWRCSDINNPNICPYSHEFILPSPSSSSIEVQIHQNKRRKFIKPKNEIDCRFDSRCRNHPERGGRCPYRHTDLTEFDIFCRCKNKNCPYTHSRY